MFIEGFPSCFSDSAYHETLRLSRPPADDPKFCGVDIEAVPESLIGSEESFKPYPEKLQNKFASESNIEDALVMLEPGLRKIQKLNDFTSDEESIEFTIPDSSEEETTRFDEPESGFYSYPHSSTPHITTIEVNQPNDNKTNTTCDVQITVNGRTVVTVVESPVEDSSSDQETSDGPPDTVLDLVADF